MGAFLFNWITKHLFPTKVSCTIFTWFYSFHFHFHFHFFHSGGPLFCFVVSRMLYSPFDFPPATDVPLHVFLEGKVCTSVREH